uniref:Nicotinamide N-methyltransferase-like n=1 Tax=Branchiostoma floridae TaxID=7739 RepID=C3YUI7_BRAFL|eukprot:XP_002600095.1 hypothetical protein BRAFLDRAFT_79647 [Branchiostoma floridae]
MSGAEVTVRMPGEDYARYFKPRDYLNIYFSSFQAKDDKDQDFRQWIMKRHHQTFQSGQFKGQRLLDIGTGPNIMSVLSASKYFPDITCTDYVQNCRDDLQLWLRDDPDAFDFGPYLQYLSTLEGGSTTPEDIATRLRAAVKAVLPCDVTQPNPLAPQSSQPFDVVISSLCLDSACKTREDFCACLGNMASLFNPGGGLILIGCINGGTTFEVGKEVFYNLDKIDEDFLRDSLAKAGFKNVEIELQSSNLDENLANAQTFMYYYLTAKKA